MGDASPEKRTFQNAGWHKYNKAVGFPSSATAGNVEAKTEEFVLTNKRKLKVSDYWENPVVGLDKNGDYVGCVVGNPSSAYWEIPVAKKSFGRAHEYHFWISWN